MTKQFPKRKQIRLDGYDYRKGGVYFVTICTHNRECLFGKIVNSKMQLNGWGQIVIRELRNMERLRENVRIDTLICMPNHLHIVIWILESPADIQAGSVNHGTNHVIKAGSLGAVIRGFKSAVTKQINLIREDKYPAIWQSRFHDRIVRNEHELNAIRRYIQANPVNWKADHEWNEGLEETLYEP